MPCECCAVQFSVFKRKRVCYECERLYCSGCLRRGGGTMCAPCRLLSTRPLSRNNIAHLKVRDLQCFLKRQNVSTRGCVEKEELVSLCVSHVNSSAYRRRGSRSSAFSSLKGLTSNLNEFINSAFCTTPVAQRHQPQRHQDTCTGNCFNSTHIHRPGAPQAPPPHTQPQYTHRPERFTTTPGGERDILVEPPSPSPTDTSTTVSEAAPARDTADCFEIEDIDDADWEFVTRPADPLPQDSDVLLSSTDNLERRSEPSAPPSAPPPAPASSEPSHDPDQDQYNLHITRATFARDYLNADVGSEHPSPGGPVRATSELDLRAASVEGEAMSDTGSLKDEPVDSEPSRVGDKLTIEGVESEAALEALSVRQLKEVLTRACVPYRGCVERGELLAHARRLYRERAAQPPPDDLPPEDACKICMAAPLECVLLECGHIATCAACARLLPECPICRRYVARAVRFFRS